MTEERREYDFFISYKWRSYSASAKSVTRSLQADGYAVWLDRDQISIEPGQRVDDDRLKKILARAAKNSEWMVFFETFAQSEIGFEMAMTYDGQVVQVPKTSDAFNWQEFERRYANRLVYIHPSRHTVEFPNDRDKIPFETLDDVVEILETLHPQPIHAFTT